MTREIISPLSRRQFLKRSGGFVAMLGLPQADPMAHGVPDITLIYGTSLGLPESVPILGRAIRNVEVRTKPEGRTVEPGAVRGRLQADSVHPILNLSHDGWWYEVNEGYVPRELMQPVTPYQRPPVSAENGYHETLAPVTVIRSYCAGHAPVLARVAQGAVLYVQDRLTDDHGQTWFAVTGSESGTGLYGWASALHFRRCAFDAPVLADPAVWIDSAGCKMSIYDGDRLVGETAIYGGLQLRGAGTLRPVAPSTWTERTPFIRPWVLSLQKQAGLTSQVYGAFWHNKFGLPGNIGNTELPVFAARWLYAMLVNSPKGCATVILE